MTEDAISKITTQLARIDEKMNATCNQFTEHMVQGVAWRRMLVGTITGVIIQVILFSYFVGNLSQIVRTNSETVKMLTINLSRLSETSLRHINVDEARWSIFDARKEVMGE